MALDSSYRREETGGAQQDREEADESEEATQPAIRPTGSGVSVMLWDEIAPAPTHTPTLADDSPEA